MKIKRTHSIGFIVVTAFCAYALTRCMTSTSSSADPTGDGGNVVVAQEADNMGVVLNESNASAKAAIADTILDTLTTELIIVPRHYNDTCQCFIRTANFTTSAGFERQRLDSIWLDSSGHLLALFSPGHADSITHIRHVNRINATLGKAVDLTFHTTLTRKLVGDSIVYQWNGTITGTFNGTTFTNSSISVTRVYVLGTGFGLANGTIIFYRGNYEVSILFGGGVETCTITDSGKSLRITHISLAYIES